MNRKRTSLFAGWLVGSFLIAGSWSASAQQPAPTENKGVTSKQLVAFDLGPEIEGMGGRQLRMRMLTIETGGVIGIHNHKDRPGTVYILQGKATEHRGGVARDVGPGDFWPEDKGTTHWLENKGTTPVVLIAVDVFKLP